METVPCGFKRITPSEKRRLVDEHFIAIAQRYDLSDTLLSFGLHHLWKRKAVKLTGLKEGDKVLDLCGGTADLALGALSRVTPSGKIVVCDMNKEMIRVGKNKVKNNSGKESILFVQGDAEEICFPDGTFDGVMVGFGIRNLVHMEKGIQESHRVLKKGGMFMVLEFSLPDNMLFRYLYHLYSSYVMPFAGRLITGTDRPFTYLFESIRVFPSPEEFCLLLADNGFTDLSYKRLTNGIAIIYICKKK